MKRQVEDGVSVLIGAGLGMALMYMIDPAEGSARRGQLRQTARKRLAIAGSAAAEGLGHLHDAVDRAAHTPAVQMLAARAADAAKGVYNDLGAHATAAVNEYHQQASDAAEDVQSKLHDKFDELRGRATDLKQRAVSGYGRWLNRSSLALGRDEDHHYIGQTACALGSLAIGASAVYLFDPTQGRERRALLIERTNSVVKETGDFFRKAGRRVAARGRVAAQVATQRAQEAVTKFQAEQASPEPVNESTQASMGT